MSTDQPTTGHRPGPEPAGPHYSEQDHGEQEQLFDLPPSTSPDSESYHLDPTHFGIEPGEPWPEDVPRDQDDTWWRYRDDPAGARKAEIKIAFMWIITLLCGLGLAVIYVMGGDPQIEGGLLALGFFCLGVGFVWWARDLLPGHDVTASRGHHSQSTEAYRTTVVASLGRGLEPIARRPFLGKALGLVGGVFGVCILFPLASLGPRLHNGLAKTAWGRNTRLVDENGRPVRPSDIDPNGILTVFPQTNPGDPQGATLLINLGPASNDYKPPLSRSTWKIDTPSGTIIAFSKICTHAGCPVGLYNTIAHELVCPCHQSTFNVLQDCKPVFGPAPRSLPQLALAVDTDGYLVSQTGYDQPVGPGYWGRG